MAPPPLLALLLLGLFAPRSLAGYCFTSVASPINGYWTWGQTVSTPTLRSGTTTTRKKSTCTVCASRWSGTTQRHPKRPGLPTRFQLCRESTWSQPGPSLASSARKVNASWHLSLSDAESHNTQRRVQMPRVSHPLMSRFPRVALNAFSHSPLPSPTSYPNPVHRPQH